MRLIIIKENCQRVFLLLDFLIELVFRNEYENLFHFLLNSTAFNTSSKFSVNLLKFKSSRIRLKFP